jgi:hypothetical protein
MVAATRIPERAIPTKAIMNDEISAMNPAIKGRKVIPA